MGKKQKKARPETFSDTFRVNYHKETEAVVKDAFSFLVSEYGFKRPRIKHVSLLSQFVYCSEQMEIEIYYEWRDSFADVKITKNGVTKRIFQLFSYIWPKREEQPSYWSTGRPTNEQELFDGILEVRNALAKCMPHILTMDFSSTQASTSIDNEQGYKQWSNNQTAENVL